MFRSCHQRRWTLAAAMVGALLLGTSPAAAVSVFSIESMTPDLSQHANGGWSNYCAPTSAANVAYYFSHRFSGLRQGGDFGGVRMRRLRVERE